MRKKKGISPLIATVLILGFTVALAAIIMVWGTRFTTSMQKQTEETANTQMKCATEVDFRISNVCVLPNNTGYKVTIDNSGQTKLDKLIVRFYAAADNMTTTQNMFPTGVDSYAITSGTFNGVTTAIKYLEAIPIITMAGEQVTCSANKQDFGSLDSAAITTACTS